MPIEYDYDYEHEYEHENGPWISSALLVRPR